MSLLSHVTSFCSADAQILQEKAQFWPNCDQIMSV